MLVLRCLHFVINRFANASWKPFAEYIVKCHRELLPSASKLLIGLTDLTTFKAFLLILLGVLNKIRYVVGCSAAFPISAFAKSLFCFSLSANSNSLSGNDIHLWILLLRQKHTYISVMLLIYTSKRSICTKIPF